jgi:hypothetical protein
VSGVCLKKRKKKFLIQTMKTHITRFSTKKLQKLLNFSLNF